MRKFASKICLAVAVLVLALVAGFGVYVSDYHKTDPAVEALLEEAIDQAAGQKVAVYELESADALAFVPENAEAGFIFYPGGKVEYTAYAPLMLDLAERGIACFIVEMPFNLAVFDINAADAVREQFPDMHWYIGGHSLGGAMAASHIASHVTDYEGLILLAAYSTEDLNGTDLRIASIYGTNDGVLDHEKYAECLPNLNAAAQELVIEGGNHAQFGSYGAQEGDGEASISSEKQVSQTADFIEGIVKAA